MPIEFWQIDLFTTDGLSSPLPVSAMRQTLPRALQTQKLFLLGSVSLHGLRAANLSREFARYRSLSARAATKLYHLGIRGQVSRNTLANANSVRDWRIYADFAQVLITRARRLYADDEFGVELDQTVYALDATTIDLCLSLFPWAKFRKHKGAVKLHTLLDLRGNIPSCDHYTWQGSRGQHSRQLSFEAGAFYIMDRGYLDFARLYQIHLSSAFFVTRARSNFDFQRLYSQPVDRTTGVICDQIIRLKVFYRRKGYPEKLRRIRYLDADSNQRLVFLTNNFTLPALTSPNSIAAAGRSNCSSNGSNNTCASKSSTALPRTR